MSASQEAPSAVSKAKAKYENISLVPFASFGANKAAGKSANTRLSQLIEGNLVSMTGLQVVSQSLETRKQTIYGMGDCAPGTFDTLLDIAAERATGPFYVAASKKGMLQMLFINSGKTRSEGEEQVADTVVTAAAPENWLGMVRTPVLNSIIIRVY